MAPQHDTSDPWAQRIRDAIATNSKIRDGLHDAEAIPLVEWGNSYAAHLSTRLSASGSTPGEEQVDASAYSLARLLTRVNWLVSYRHKKDAAWLTRTFQTVNDLSREMLGDGAPVFSDDEIAAWLATHADHSDAELLQGLIARLAPSKPESAPGAPAPAGVAGSIAGTVAAAAASITADVIAGLAAGTSTTASPPDTTGPAPAPRLPGRAAPPDSGEQTDSPFRPGDDRS